ncbi:AMP-binding protein [Frateuria aurantia]|uniref:Acyl-CoA synthetase/AMP-acid ligase n=1 Tax=Frateuria aurantia (strain ATCC 33424 / DSM 6220 / KCTC 2777 / LMG 1558 / NBRC 3245 / NCIMB 13370) TaxID=767434 RepID=H8L3N3_FRAAD|nr:AMP-binding protein [Frateuria aurantia]AFC87402.1 acyl-CoA synthetase/AMP-acid ligase [Frateuria aurantia DSM 6220]
MRAAPLQSPGEPAGRPLLVRDDPDAMLAWHQGKAVTVAGFLAEVAAVAERLPEASAALNLADDRYAFSVLFCALLWRGQTNLLPSSRSPAAIAAVAAAFPGCQEVDDADARSRLVTAHPEPLSWPRIAGGITALVACTSGTTGEPRCWPRSWDLACQAHAGSRLRLQSWFGSRFSVVATVPPQHMFGWEFTVLLPLQSEVCVHAGRPLFPADIAAALAEMPAPRVLVTTPLHLRTLAASGMALPPLAGILSATAPLDEELATIVETRLGAPVYEIYGSTETCAIASRRTIEGAWWQPMPGIRLRPGPEGCEVTAAFMQHSFWLGDLIELDATGERFRLIGRQQDLLEVAGKRMSLAALNRHLLAIPGVVDGVALQQAPGRGGVGRIAALVVAPGLDEATILDALRRQVDPVFLPRPLRRVAVLPRNDTGKLPRAVLLAMLQAGRPGTTDVQSEDEDRPAGRAAAAMDSPAAP